MWLCLCGSELLDNVTISMHWKPLLLAILDMKFGLCYFYSCSSKRRGLLYIRAAKSRFLYILTAILIDFSQFSDVYFGI